MDMPKTRLVLEIDNPHFTVKLYENILQIDLKGTTKNKIEEALENKPVLRQTVGTILGIFVPLHIRLSDIDDARPDESGKVKIILPRHRDVTIPLQPGQARKLMRKLNELIPKDKKEELRRTIRREELQRIAEERLALGRGGGATYPGSASSITATPAVADALAEAEEKEEQKKED